MGNFLQQKLSPLKHSVIFPSKLFSVSTVFLENLQESQRLTFLSGFCFDRINVHQPYSCMRDIVGRRSNVRKLLWKVTESQVYKGGTINRCEPLDKISIRWFKDILFHLRTLHHSGAWKSLHYISRTAVLTSEQTENPLLSSYFGRINSLIPFRSQRIYWKVYPLKYEQSHPGISPRY